MRDDNRVLLLLEFYRNKSQCEVSRDYFLYHALQYESCLGVENSKKFVVTSSWIQLQNKVTDFSSDLPRMTTWYRQNFPVFKADDSLTFETLYFYLPIFIDYIAEARRLWELTHKKPPPEYDQNSFWAKLLALLRTEVSYSHLAIPYLHWRYGRRKTVPVPPNQSPPNPFAERRIFSDRRGHSNHRERRNHKEFVERKEPASRRNSSTRCETHATTSLTAEMTNEIREAVTLMKNNRHQEVILKPANSYYRRLQHKMVANMGFTSVSVGDNRESRAVKIVQS